MALSRADLDKLGGRTSREVPVPALGGALVRLWDPTALDRDEIEALFVQSLGTLAKSDADEITPEDIGAMRALFRECIAKTLGDDEGALLYASGEEVGRALRREVVDDLGSEAWPLFGLGQDAKNDAVGNSASSHASGSPSA